jgi:hypothetical protein
MVFDTTKQKFSDKIFELTPKNRYICLRYKIFKGKLLLYALQFVHSNSYEGH